MNEDLQNDATGAAHARLERARWRSRRGLLELELLLKPFAAERLAEAGAARLDDYEALLTHDDLDVHEWLMRRADPPAELAAIVTEIRTFLALD